MYNMFSLQDCGIPTVIHKDVEAQELEASIEQQPWMVSLGRFTGILWSHECSGSLITNRHVLTAANCFEGIRKNEDLLNG
jgi:secreted trypsin-like serine protease